MEQKFAGRLLLILAVLLIGVLGIFPPGRVFDSSIPWSRKHNLKPGIDISGGTSLLYEIKAPPGQVSEDLSQRVAEALKKRVDPEGVRNLVWRPTGATQLEIQMPLTAGAGVSTDARLAYTRAQQELEATNIRVGKVRAAVQNSNPNQRKEQLAALAMGSSTRTQLFDRYARLLSDYAAAEKANDSIRKVDLRDEIAKVENDIEATNLSVNSLQQQLTLFQEAIEKAKRKPAVVEQKLKERSAKIDQYKRAMPDFAGRQAAIEKFVSAFDAYAQVKGNVDDAEGLKRLLKGSGVLEFHILVTDASTIEAMRKRLMEEGPALKPGDTTQWFEVERPQEFGRPTFQYGDKHWALAYITPDKSLVHKEGGRQWGLQRARKDYDGNTGRPAVAFEFDPAGGALFGELSGANIHQPLAIVLDEKIISAPTLQSRIEDRGQITGSFSDADIDYLVRTLNAGSLPARLTDEPISERTVSPSLGRDNLRAGFIASLIGLVVVVVFLVGYYYMAGIVASIAVMMNLVIILGAMAALGATFTLPGIAAFVLSVGMAVDANVLIFERLREEQHRGLSLRLAIRNAYDRAFSAILDSNVTTAITSLVLYVFGSEEVKGFGLTLLIGMVSSLFTALFVTRTIFDFMLERMHVKKLGSLPLTYPNWDNALRPNIDWMGKAWIFYAFSAVFIVAGLSAFIVKGRDMFDIEFVKGTAVQVELKKDVDIEQMRKMLEPYSKPNQLPSAAPVSIGNSQREYEIVTPNDNASQVKEAVLVALKDVLAIDLPSVFTGSDASFEDAERSGMVTPIIAQTQGGARVLTVPGLDWVPNTIDEHEGGVAIVLKNLRPAISAKEIASRVERARLRDNLPFRTMNVETRGGDQAAETAVVLVSDPALRYDPTSAEKQGVWRQELARTTWKLVRDAVSEPPALQKVVNFNPQVAAATLRDAIVAVALSIGLIMLYIWIRFGNLKYGTATVASLLHDALIVIGAVGLSHYVADTFIGRGLLIDAFRMNLTLVAAVLTVMGYSMNDTIVVFDRIRENRGKYGFVSRQIINDSINQTLSRTLLTGGTTIITVFVMYLMGGPGIHGFTFALLIGILVGTYSSIAIAAPILLIGATSPQPAVADQKKMAVGQVPRAVGH